MFERADAHRWALVRRAEGVRPALARSRAPVVVMAAGLIVVFFAGCSASANHGAAPTRAATMTGTVSGTLRLNGGPPGETSAPAPGEVFVFTSAALTGTPTAKTKAGADGTFHIELPAGTYYFAATSPDYTLDPPPAVPPCGVVCRGLFGQW
jgi:hypothetical protein